jgi:ABC-2 type transport system permease protein
MNTSVTLSPSVTAPHGTMSARRLVHAYFTEAKYEFLKMLRTPGMSVPVLLLPVVMYLLFGVLMGSGGLIRSPDVGTYLFCGFAVFGATAPGLLGIGVSLAQERDAGFLKLKRALPAPPGAYLLAKMLMAMMFAAITTTSMLLAGLLLGKLTLSGPQIAARPPSPISCSCR